MERFNPRMLELAREARRMTQSALAAACGVAQGTISKVEAGLLEPTPDLLGQLARALEYPREFFSRSSAPPARLLPREMASLPVRDRRAVIASLKIRCLEIEALLRSVDILEVQVPRLRLGVDVASPSEAAARVRELWRLRPGPIDNVVALLESKGILVLDDDFGVTKMDGLSHSEISSESSLPPVVFLNRNSPGDRVRFTMAHELGHHVMHHQEHAADASDDCESEANEFAAAFLMPERDIRSHFHARLSLDDLASLKQHWKVSMQALLMRARATGRITEAHSTRLWKRLSMLGYRSNEPVFIEREQPTLLRDVLLVHRNELGYSDAELSELLRLTINEFRRLYLGERPALRLIG